MPVSVGGCKTKLPLYFVPELSRVARTASWDEYGTESGGTTLLFRDNYVSLVSFITSTIAGKCRLYVCLFVRVVFLCLYTCRLDFTALHQSRSIKHQI